MSGDGHFASAGVRMTGLGLGRGRGALGISVHGAPEGLGTGTLQVTI